MHILSGSRVCGITQNTGKGGSSVDIVLARVDERLIHGQIINAWYTRNNISHIFIVDKELVEDQFMTNVYKALAPLLIQVEVFTVDGLLNFLHENRAAEGRILLLTRTLAPIAELAEKSALPGQVFLADKKYFPNKIPITEEDKQCVNRLAELGIVTIAQEYPDDESFLIKPFHKST